MPVPRKTIKKLGLTIVRLIACMALIPFESERLASAFIIKVEKAKKSPAIIPLPMHAAIRSHSRSFGESSMQPCTTLSLNPTLNPWSELFKTQARRAGVHELDKLTASEHY